MKSFYYAHLASRMRSVQLSTCFTTQNIVCKKDSFATKLRKLLIWYIVEKDVTPTHTCDMMISKTPFLCKKIMKDVCNDVEVDRSSRNYRLDHWKTIQHVLKMKFATISTYTVHRSQDFAEHTWT